MSRRREGIVSVLVVLLLIIVARSSQHAGLMMLADLVIYLSILAALVWVGHALVRRFAR